MELILAYVVTYVVHKVMFPRVPHDWKIIAQLSEYFLLRKDSMVLINFCIIAWK